MEVKLIKNWGNHRKGDYLVSVNPRFKASLENLGVIKKTPIAKKKKPRKRKTKAVKASPANKMISESPKIKTEEVHKRDWTRGEGFHRIEK